MYIIETIEFDACKIRRLKQALEYGDFLKLSYSITLLLNILKYFSTQI